MEDRVFGFTVLPREVFRRSIFRQRARKEVLVDVPGRSVALEGEISIVRYIPVPGIWYIPVHVLVRSLITACMHGRR